MKIAMFTDAYWPRVNGVTVSVDTYAHALVKAGHEVVIVCSEYPMASMTETIAGNPQFSSGSRPAAGEAGKPALLRIPSNGVFFSREDRQAKFTKRRWFERKLMEFAPDILHINTEFVVANFGFTYGKKYKVPMVYTFHTIWEDYIKNYFPYIPEAFLRLFVKKYMKHLMKKSDMIIVPTPQIEQIILNYNLHKELRMLPTGVDPALFRHEEGERRAFRSAFDGKYPAARGRRLLLFAGRVAKEKNISFIIRLLAALTKRCGDLALVIAGNGPDLEYYRKEAQSLGTGDRCVFTGYLDRSELSLVYSISHLFVFPSLTETQGLVTIEAMLSGIPVVAIGVKGTVEVMGGDNGGFMVPDDEDIFRRRTLELLENDELYRQKSGEARRHAQQWTVDALTEKLVGIYRETLVQKIAGDRPAGVNL